MTIGGIGREPLEHYIVKVDGYRNLDPDKEFFIDAVSAVTVGPPFSATITLDDGIGNGLTLIREITKDIADLEGDQIAKHNTYPIEYGIKGAIKLISVLSCVVSLSALVPYFNNTYNDWYLIILLIGVEIPLIIVVFLLVKNPTISSAILSSKILKFSTIMGLSAIYTGSL